MAKRFAISTQVGGAPVINTSDSSTLPYTPCRGWVQCGTIGQYGGYLFSGTASQLQAINALSNVYGLCAMTDTGTVCWAELDGTVTTAFRNKANLWLTARGWPTIPAGATWRQVVLAVFKRLNNLWSLSSHDILDSPN